MKKKDIRSLWLRRLLKLHTIALTISLGVYFLLAFLDPGLFSYDMREKFRALAEDIAVTATVLGPPATPVVTATAECDESTGTLSVELDWADDANAYTYDIDRNSLSLISGLSNSSHSDTNVTLSTTYEYIVTANGPMGPGSASSSAVPVTTSSQCNVTVDDPEVEVVSFQGKNVASLGGTPEITNRRPLFTGTTNIPNAIIQILVESDPYYATTITANANGYWEWRQPVKLTDGKHTLTVTTIDPADSSRRAVSVFSFKIESEKEKTSSKKKTSSSGVSSSSNDQEEAIEPLVDFSVSVKNSDEMVLQGDKLLVTIQIHDLHSQYDDTSVPIRYSVTDEYGNILSSVTKEIFLRRGREILESFPIPLYFAPGKEVIRTEILLSEMIIGREAVFSVVELPLIQLSNGQIIAYADLIRNLGWIAFLFFFVLFLWFFLLLREFAFYIKGKGHITERDLNKAGFFRK